MKKELLDIKANKVGEIELNDSVFGIKPNEEVLALYTRVFRSNQRKGTSSTKTRAEVSGSGRKPWSQKGTGRARVGDKRNPIWVKGGIAHGPKPKSWALSLPKKLKKLAIRSALSIKTGKNALKVLEDISFKEPKTKEMLDFMRNHKLRGKTLLVMHEVNNNVIKSGSNIKDLSTTFIDNLNAYEILLSKNLVLTKQTVEKLNERYQK